MMAKEDMVEDVRAVYGGCTAEQMKRERNNPRGDRRYRYRGNEDLLDPHRQGEVKATLLRVPIKFRCAIAFPLVRW